MSSAAVCRLPYEIIRAIFELAASDSPCTTFTLLLVSRAARNWLERRLYAKVNIEDQNEHDMFERCMSTRDDDGFIASAVQQLSTGPNSDLLNICNNITHLTSPNWIWKIMNRILPPNITHLQFCDVVWSNVVALVVSARSYPLLSHILLDCDFNDIDAVYQFAEHLPDIMDASRQCQLIAFTVPRIDPHDHSNINETMLADVKNFQEQYYPQLILVGTGEPEDIFQNTMQCPDPLLSQFEFWDELEKSIARKQT